MIDGRQGRATRRPTPTAVFLVAVVVAAVALGIAGAHVRPTGTSPSGSASAPSEHIRPPDHPTQTAAPRRAAGGGSGSASIDIVAVVGGLLLLSALLLLPLWLLFRLQRALPEALRVPRRHRGRGRRRLAPVVTVAPDDAVRAMSKAVGQALAELETGRPVDDAIVQCWQRLGVAAATAGIPPVASDTPDEAIKRIFFASEVSAGPLKTLAELYREARFSRHSMDDDDLVAARAALTEILEQLTEPSHAV